MDQNPQILIVEDDEMVLNNSRRTLETAGYHPACAHSGQEALELLAQRPFDLALVDLGLADVPGVELCRRIKAAQPAFVVMLTDGTFPESASSPAEGGLDLADGFIRLPILEQELLAHLRAYLRLQQTQAALLACQASQAGFLSFVDQASEGIFMLDEQGVIVEFNAAMEKMTGLARQQALGLTAWDFQFQFALENHLTPAFYERVKARWLEAIRIGQSPLLERPIEAIFHRADGSLRVVSQSLFATRTATGFRIGGIARDVTEQKQAQEALRASEARFRQLYESMIDGYGSVDLEGRFLDFNETLQNMLGYTAEELRQLTYFDITPEKWRAFEAKIVAEQILPRGFSDVYEKEYRRKDGTIFPVELHTVLLHDESGKPTATWAIVRDITERKLAEEALFESEGRYYSLFENASIGIFHSLPEGRFLRANPALATMLGYSSPEELISTVTDIRTQVYANPDRHVQALTAVTQQQDWLRVENQYRRKDGRLITGSLVVRRVLKPDGTLAYLEGFVEDITARRRIENELRLDEQRLQGLLEISQHQAESIDALLAFAVRQAVDLTGSHIGYLFSYDEKTQELTLNIRSLDVMAECAISYPKSVYRLDETGLSGEPIRQRQPVLVNDFQAPTPLKRGYPEGHARIDRFLSIPVFSQERIVAVVAVANKVEEYDQADIRQLTLLMTSVWGMVEAKQTEVRLRVSEERLRYALEAANDGLWDENLTTAQTYYSPRYYTMLGYQPGEFPANQAAFLQLVHPDDLARVQQALDDYYAGRSEAYEVEFRMLAKSGEVAWILSRGKAIERNAQGLPQRMVGTHTDITQRKLAEEALRASEERYRRIFADSPLGIFTSGQDMRFITANAAFCRLLGYREAELLGISFKDITHPAHAGQDVESVLKVMAGDIPLYRTEKRYLRKDGQVVWAATTVTAIRNLDGQFLYNLAMIEDISERKQTEEALRASEERFRQVTESTGDFIWEMDAEGLYLYASPVVEQILGYTPDELVGKKHWYELATPDARQEIRAAAQKAFDNKEPFRGELSENVHKDGKLVILESSGSPVLDAAGNLLGYRGADTDVTGRIHTEQALRQSEARLKRAERMAHLGSSTWEVVPDITTWSDEMYRITGWDPAAPPPKRSERGKIYTPESWARLEPKLLRALTTGEPYDLELDLLRPDGSVCQVHVHGEAETDENGDVVRMHSTLQDISELRQAQENLRQAHQQLNAIIQALPLAISALDRQGRITLWSPACERLYGWTQAEALGLEPPMAAEELHAEVRQQIHEELQGTQRRAETYRRRRKDGTLVDINLSTAPLRDALGHITGSMAIAEDITERKRAEEALLESEARLKEAERMAHLGSFSWDAATQTRHWSDELYRIVGRDLSTPAPSQAEWAGYFTPESWAIYEPTFQKAVRAGEPYDLELEMVRSDGALRQVTMHGAAVTNGGGQVVRLHGTLQDVTELRQAQENLRQTNQQLNAIIQASPLGISAIDRDGLVTLWSPACERLFGHTQAEVLGHELPIIPDELREEVRQQIHEEMLGTQRTGMVNIRRRKDGTPLDINLSTAPLLDARGTTTGSMAIYEDISQRKRAEQDLRESETKFRAILENSRDAIDVSQGGRHVYVNPAFLQLFGYTENNEIDGQDLFNLVAPEDRQRVMEISHRRTQGQEAPGYYEVHGLRKDGSQFDMEVKADTYELQGELYTLAVLRDVTERKRAEAERQALLEIMRGVAVTENLQELLEQVRQSLARVIYAENFYVVFYNKSSGMFEEVFSVDKYDPPTPPAKLEKSITAYVFRTGEPLLLDQAQFIELQRQGVVELIGANMLSWMGAPIKTPGGTIGVMAVQHYEDEHCYSERDRVFFASVAGQVSLAIERKQAEETLRRSEEGYRMLAENTTDLVWVMGQDLKYTYTSPSMVRQRGYTLEELNALPLEQQIAPDSLETLMQLYRQLLGGEKLAVDLPVSLTRELEIYRKDGTSYWSETTFSILRDQEGKWTGILGSGRDVTQRKRAEQALRESEERFRSFMEQSAEAVTLMDEEGRIIEWNDSQESLSGLKRQDVNGKFFWDVLNNLIPPEKRSQQAFERSRAALLQALHTGQSPMFNHTIEGEMTRPDGERRTIRQTVFPIKTDKGFRLGGVSQDITELKQAEALRLAKEAAEAANLAKSEFLANMSHELRTPLNAMMGFSDMLSQQYYGPLTGKQVEYVQDIHESATYLLALINDILDLSKIEAGRMELETSRVDLKSLFEHSLVVVRERANKHSLYLSSNIDPRLAGREFLADERKIRQVLYNLLANAVKFTPDGGAVDLSARLVDEKESHPGQPWVEVSVTDTGTGLAPEDRERIFEAFYQVKNSEAGKTPGTGLGLSLVRRMVELHGGQVWAESKGPGWGSRFVVTLPLRNAQPGEKE